MKARTQRTMLTLLRQKLGTWPEELPAEDWVDQSVLGRARESDEQFNRAVGRIRAFGELFVGMANGPFLLVMKADDPGRFIRFADETPTHQVFLSIERVPIAEHELDADLRNKFTFQAVIQPAQDRGAYRLVFGLPEALEQLVLQDENRGLRLAPGVKRQFLSEITVYRRVDERDVVYRLVYTPQTRNVV
jgi:hypothetical protein